MARIFQNVALGDGAIVDETATIGLPPAGAADGELPTVIGPGASIRSHTVVYAGTTIGAGFNTGHGALVREGQRPRRRRLRRNERCARVRQPRRDRVRIHTGCFLENCVVEDDVFLGPHVVFTDDPHPACPRYRDCVGGATVRRQASIGANVTVLPGIEIGERALVGAGSVVTENVPAGMVVAGNPARVVKKVEELVCWPGFFERPYVWREEHG